MSVSTIEIKGERYVLVEKAEYDRMKALADKLGRAAPSIPEPDERGLRPAIPAMRAVIARDIIQDRLAAGITQRELARRAGVRPETLSRIEAGKHTPTETTVARIYRALGQATETTTSDETASKRKAKRDGKRPTQLKRAKVGQ